MFRKCNDVKIMIVYFRCNSLKLHFFELLNLGDVRQNFDLPKLLQVLAFVGKLEDTYVIF